MNNIVNIINFARNCEPRVKDDSFLFTTFAEEMKLCAEYGFRSTALLQYDALIDRRYTDLVKNSGGLCECGLWLELTEPQVTDAGLSWRGRTPWDWVNNVGFLLGYTPEEREKLIDTAFGKFREIFGHFPEVFGCWVIDAYSMKYIEDHYAAAAACICKEQSGTDGISVWGGYLNGGYYPCKNNFLCPAAKEEDKLRTPVFRMLGPDPIVQYDMGLGEPDRAQRVTTLEPVYGPAGGSRDWVEWYFRENFNGKCLSHAYTQMGQENSFGWDAIRRGLPMQFEILDREIKAGNVSLMTLGETGKWFSERFSVTPPAAICTDSDAFGNGYKSLWYNCGNYRANVLFQKDKAWIRDMQLFDPAYREKYLDRAEDQKNCAFFDLPVIDGFRFSTGNTRAGIYVYENGEKAALGKGFETYTEGKDTAGAVMDAVRFEMTEDAFTISFARDGLYLAFECGENCELPYIRTEGKELFMRFRGRAEEYYDYSLRLGSGVFGDRDGKITVTPENGKIILLTAPQKQSQ